MDTGRPERGSTVNYRRESPTESVRIVHVSDLHFGVNGQLQVWRSLRQYINNEIKPHLILVSGDIVDTPGKDAYQTAKNELDQLQASGAMLANVYRVCPGNHDRHPVGNAPGKKFKRVFDFLKRAPAADAWFDNVFGAFVARPESATDFRLAAGTNTWRVRVVGFDTSERAEYSAQGFAAQEKIDELTGTLENIRDSDLVIVLLHHHLLPIMELEQAQQRLRNLIAPTIMLNAGTLLERLAQGNVNLVLHGHEHQRALARYGTFSGRQSEIVILAAGSGTGVETLGGAEPNRASLNLIKLGADRTVSVSEIRNRAGAWSATDAPEVLLLNARQIDRSRFYRCTGSASLPTSQITKCIEFHANRDLSITETRTNWVIKNGYWDLAAQNSSGWLSPAHVTFEWPQSGKNEFQAEPVCDPASDHMYRFRCKLPHSESQLARRIQVAYRWFGGGVLTEQDLQLLDASKRGDFRGEGLEFTGIRVQNELEAISLVVRIPLEFAPSSESIEVSVVPHGAGANKRRRDDVLTRALQHHAPGMFSLELPYPTTGLGYVLSWKPPPGIKPSEGALAFYEKARVPEHAASFLAAFRQSLNSRTQLTAATVALYVPTVEQPLVFRRAACHIPESFRGSEPPAELSLRAGDTLYRHAWWGEMKMALKDDNDNREYGFALGEGALAVIPICQYGRVTDVPWGLLRVGVPPDAALPKEGARNFLSHDMFANGILSVLHAAQTA
jgi:3',5'-cyclic AMP phosphodiesterase CpdA